MKPIESQTRPDEGMTGESSLIAPVLSPESGRMDGEHAACYGVEQRHGSTEDNRLGEDGGSASGPQFIDGDSLVNVDHIIENFQKMAGKGLRGETPKRYVRSFERFAEAVDLERYTRRQLAGRKGQELLLRYLLGHVSAPSRKTRRSILKCVWMEGLNLPYPVSRRQLGELPEVQERQSPRDSDVLPWLKAIEREEEPYLKVMMLIVFQLGVRPSHARLFRWKHVRFGLDGKPDAIITSGREPGNKRMTRVSARLPPDLSEALTELKKTMPGVLIEDPILPHRMPDGSFERNVEMTDDNFPAQWRRFQAKHLLTGLRPVDLRHWVSKICRMAGLSYAATNLMQGHKCNSKNMRDRYDHPEDEEIFAEQASVLPHGPIGFVCPKIELDQALPAELTQALGRCLKGEMLPGQFAETITAYLTRQLKKPVSTIVV
jgi:integrase